MQYAVIMLPFLFTAATVLSTGTSLQDHSVSLLLPGKVLHISALLAAKHFKDKGNKEGAVRAIKRLQEAGLGTVIECKPPRGTSMVCCMHGR